MGILVRIFLGRILEVLKLNLFSSLLVHFQWFLTLDEHSPLVGSIVIFKTILGRALVRPPTSSLPDLYLGKMC